MAENGHLTRARISALLDEPWPEGRAHLEACASCRREYEEMSRMRMAISALGELEPPAGEWERIAARLGAAPGAGGAGAGAPAGGWGGRGGRGRVVRLASAVPWPLQAAAVLALFAAGIAVGRGALDGDGSPPARVAGLAEESGGLAGEDGAAGGGDVAGDPREAYLRTVAGLAELGTSRSGGQAWPDPETAALELARLDAVREALSDALREAPADPVLNNLLFEVAEERSALSSQMAQTLQLAGMEYR